MPNSVLIPFPLHPDFPPLEVRFSGVDADHLEIYHKGFRFMEVAYGGGHVELTAAGSLPVGDPACTIETTPAGLPIIHGIND